MWNDFAARAARAIPRTPEAMSRSAAPLALFLLLSVGASHAAAQNPLRDPLDAVELRFARSQPVVAYTLRVAPGDVTGFDVEMRIRNAPDTIRLAIAAHPEYDDRYWRYVSGATATTPRGRAVLVKEDSSLWRLVAPGGEAVVRYRIRLPVDSTGGRPRATWKPFITPTGALAGGPHSFMYIVGSTLAPS